MELVDYATVLGSDLARLSLRAGQRHDVVLDEAARVAWRFPRTPTVLDGFAVTVDRTRGAANLGLPAPEVLDVVTGVIGSARMGVRLLSGSGMSRPVVEAFGPRSRATLLRDLVALLGGLRAAQPPSWPGAEESWPARWRALALRLEREVLPLIDSAKGRLQAESDISTAVEAAAVAGTYGLTHGDLGGENVLLDPHSGHVTGVLDWDDAVPGDPAVDLAAILAHAPGWLADGLFALDPTLRPLATRAEAYLGTFALQQALWGLEADDEAEVTEGLATYLAMG